MSQEKYIGMDVHQATISVAVMDAGGKLIMECLLETKAATIVEFILLRIQLHLLRIDEHRDVARAELRDHQVGSAVSIKIPDSDS
jgi:hypothetical protein